MEPAQEPLVASETSSNAPTALPRLNHRTEFEIILKDYRMSEAALATLRQTPLVLMVSVTAAGRNTIMSRHVEGGKYHYLVSDTTRPMRSKDGQQIEHDGVEYFFRKEQDVLNDLRDGRFVEAKIIHNQQVSGISVREIERAHDSHRIAMTDITVDGFETIAAAKPDTIGIFPLPPSFDEWLGRIARRSQLTDEELKNRLESAVEELGAALEDTRFIFVINDNLGEAIETVDAISRLGKHNQEIEAKARDLAEHLREETALYLQKYPNW